MPAVHWVAVIVLGHWVGVMVLLAEVLEGGGVVAEGTVEI